eukprot:5960663-Lingulodinium_polyedra.AAC.1
MAWRADVWPGKLALCASALEPERRRALQDLRTDWKAWQHAEQLSQAFPFLAKLVAKPPTPPGRCW